MKIIIVILIYYVLLHSVESASVCEVVEGVEPNAMDVSSRYWEKALVVKTNRTENLLVQRQCNEGTMQTNSINKQPYCKNVECRKEELCYNVKIPSIYLSACYSQKSGNNTLIFPEGKGLAPNELLILVGSNFNGSCRSDVVAWATICHQDPTTKRPFLGEMNYCYSETKILELDDIDLIQTTKHEMGHVLGFHPDIFNILPALKPEFQLSNNVSKPLQDITLDWLSTKGRFNVTKTILRLPNMLNEAKQHFGCNELRGIEISSNHLSHRIMGNDIFTPFKQHSSLVSRISLAYFKDTNHEDIQPFCDTPEKLRCLSYEKAIGTCTMWKMYRELPSQYQYMDDTFEVPARYRAYYSGSDLYDYCPVYESKERPDLNIGHFKPTMNELSPRSNKLKRAISQIKPGIEDFGRKPYVTTNLLFEDLGPNTACFDHSKLIKQNGTSIDTFSRLSSCHKFECSTGKGLQIIVNEQKFPCSTGSNTANVTFTIQRVTYSMTIFCPPCRSLCKDSCPQ
ncbi:Leishmanolysin-like peptidase [Schistosoma japonicum]|uniref:Leishmanolysin-like peptidase n=1 Tax=Schistosoma japonicum TaxID=6182 RepID=A0A4Z2CM80_SCHJA|nr:Leishmanolysin-like peptidase [Schistosoma japonicum]